MRKRRVLAGGDARSPTIAADLGDQLLLQRRDTCIRGVVDRLWLASAAGAGDFFDEAMLLERLQRRIGVGGAAQAQRVAVSSLEASRELVSVAGPFDDEREQPPLNLRLRRLRSCMADRAQLHAYRLFEPASNGYGVFPTLMHHVEPSTFWLI